MALAWLAGAAASRPVLAQADAGYRQLPDRAVARGPGAWASRVPPSIAPLRASSPIDRCPIWCCPAKRSRVRPEFTRTPAQYLDADYLGRLGEQGRALLKQHAAHAGKDRARNWACNASSCWRSGAARPPSAATSFQLLCDQGARHPGLSGPPQGHVPQRTPPRPEDARGRGAHARNHDGVVGRRHGPHPVHAVGILHRRL